MHALLRQRTARLHAALDAVPFLARLLSKSLTLEHYLRVLKGFDAFMEPLEATLSQSAVAPELALRVPDLALRWRASRLKADMRCVEELLAQGNSGNHGNQERGAQVPAPPQVAIGSLDEAFGLLYVLEGSTLGGSVIAARVQASLGLKPDQGVTFFCGRGSWTGEAWKGFLQALATYHAEAPSVEAREERERAIVAKACETFEALTRSFQKLE
ncbi:MAG: biliverdin-producing heme oxygenase [Silvanigrellales bacterium]|nr:biliverdin-producing heme oxygenase [Silvanigrellales bacterium]